MFRKLTMLFNPFTRTAALAFAWSHRRTVMRWGRSFYTELKKPGKIDPGRLQTIAKVLWEITGDDDLANAKQLRAVRLDGDKVVVDTSAGWKQVTRLVDLLDDIEGVNGVVDTKGNRLSGSIEATAY